MSAATGQSLVVGVEAMDDQRGILMDTIDELLQKLSVRNNHEDLDLQMAWLVQFVEMHFGCEETLLRRYGFPGLEEHCTAHERFLERIESAVEENEIVADKGLRHTLGLLRDEFVEHVEKLDRRCAEWLNARGVF